MKKKLLSILALLCLAVTSAWADNYTSFSGGEVLKPGDTFEIAEGSWEINEMVFDASRSPFTVLRANVFPGENTWDPSIVDEDENGMFYVIKDKNSSYYFTDTEKFNLIFTQDINTGLPYDGIEVTKTDDTHYTFAGHEVAAATSGYCGDPSDNNGENVTWELTGTTITISGNGAMANFDSPYMGYGTPAPWLASYANKITSIVIEEGVTTVGEYAFEDCNLVESISIPASVTIIGEMAFCDCGYTDDYTFTNPTVTIASGSNLETIGNSAFEYCQMTSFSIPNGVKTIGEGAFSYCFGLTSIEMPASVTSIGWNAFYLCRNLATLTLNSNPYIDATAFNYAGEATAEFNQGSTTVTMNLTATVGENDEYWMTFYNQNHKFQVPAEGTQIFKASLGDDKLLLTELTTDKRVNANNAVILKSATASITLTRTTAGSSNDFTGNDLAGVSDVAGATSDGTFYALNDGTQDVGFYPVASGTKVALGNAYVTSNSSSDFLPFVYVIASGYCGDPSVNDGKNVTYSLTDDGVMTISGTGAMADNDYETPWSAYQNDITSVVIENGVTSVGARAFTSCSNVTSVSLPANLQAIGAMAFARCDLTSITLPASLEAIGMRAFQGTKITSVNIPANVTSIGDLPFGYCSSLAEITVDANNTVYEAPNGCNALIVKATHTLIQGCSGTVFANLPADLKSIAEAAFAGCTGLTTVTFPDGLESIGGNAFESCSGLTTVTIPASVEVIGDRAFGWCDNLTTVTIYATSLTTYGEEAFGNSFTGTIYVPAGSGDTYKAAWTAYESNIEEMAAQLNDNDDNSTILASLDGKTIDIYVDRTLGTGKWYTLCLPFNVDLTADGPLKGVSAKTLSSVTNDGTTLTVTFGDDEMYMKAGMPYIVRLPEDATMDIVDPLFEGATISKDLYEVEVSEGAATFKGTYAPVVLPAGDKKKLFLQNNTLYYPGSDATIKAFRAYIELDADVPGTDAPNIVINFDGDDNGEQTTGITTTDCTDLTDSNAWYDLSGRRIANGQKPKAKGVYFNGGRKVVIK